MKQGQKKTSHKNLIFGVAVVVVVLAIVLFFSGGNVEVQDAPAEQLEPIEPQFAGEEMMVDITRSSLSFVGGKVVGSSHPGTFEDWEAYVYVEDGQVTGVEGTAQAATIKTDSAGLDRHLKSDDFFDVERYAEVRFVSTSIVDGTLTGFLDLHGTRNEISIPVTFGEDRVSGSIALDAELFNFKYDAVLTDVEIEFEFVY